jgi:CHAT domain-containing protein/Tfp pilus assembly protein PilF
LVWLAAISALTAQDAALQSVVVVTDNAPLQNGRELVARVRQGERLPVLRAQGDWLLVRSSRNGQFVEGWINRRHVRPTAAGARGRSANPKAELAAAMQQADALSAQGDYAQAAALYELVVDLAPEVFGAQSYSTGAVIHNLANLYQELGRYREAESCYLRAMEIVDAARGKGHIDTVSTRNSLANVYTLLGRYEEAEQLHRECLKARENYYGPDDPAVAQTLNNLGLLLQDVGRYGEAEQAFRRSLAIREEKFGKDDLVIASSLYNLAILCQLRGEFAQADALLRRSLGIEEAQLDKDHPDIAKTLVELANVAIALGQYADAEPSLVRALAIVEHRFGKEHARAVSVLATLAQVYQETNRAAQAEEFLLRCLKLAEAELGEDDLKVAWTLNNLANLYQDSHQFTRAEPLAVRSWKIKEQRLGKNHPDVATALNNLGNLYHGLDNLDKSEQFHKQALTLRTSLLGENHPDVAQSYRNIGLAQAYQGQWADAAENFDRCRRVVRRHVARVLLGLPEREQLSFLTAADAHNLHLACSLGWFRRDDALLAARSASWVINSKGLAQQTLAQRALLARAVGDPQQAALARELVEVRQQLAVWTFRTTANSAEAALRTRQIGRLEEREGRLSAELGQLTGTVSTDDPWVELDAMRRALPAGAVLIEIARFDLYDFVAKREQGGRYAAWLIFPSNEAAARLIDLGPAAPIEKALQSARRALDAAPAAISKNGESEAEQVVRRPLQALSQLVLHPLLPHIGEQRQWIVSPDGALWLAPWAALPLPDGRYAVEDHEIAHVVSGRELAIPAAPSNQPEAPLVLADPDFDAEPNSTASGSSPRSAPDATKRRGGNIARLPRFARLPATASEARAIVPSIEQFSGAAPRVYTGVDAKEGVFKAAGRPLVLTLSTHGFFLKDQETPLLETQALTESVRSTVLTVEGKPLENPLLRCGLVLAGCNQLNVARDGDDGVLTGLEIVGSDLRGTKLVVLSACETGVGEMRNGEGVAGLRQAFQLAGAEAVVASLWSVPDLETARLMKSFFEQLADGKAKSAALRAAQLERIANRRERSEAAHPFYWAAFTVTGK